MISSFHNVLGNVIDRLYLRLCMKSRDEKSSNYLLKLATCIATLSASRYGSHNHLLKSTIKLSIFLNRTSRTSPRSSDFERGLRVETGSTRGARVFCTGARHWLCNLGALTL